jgi:cytidine deaminase
MNCEELIRHALKARENSYCPYSSYAVGACVECADGSIFEGCNVENASYGATNCAERTAIFKAVSEGHKEIVAIAIVGGKVGEEITDFAYPCGVCRQVINEFAKGDAKIIVAKSENDYKDLTLQELLPEAFGPNNLS